MNKTEETEIPEVRMVLIRLIIPDPKQPRRVFELEPLQGLANSIRENGVQQPIHIRPPKDGQYLLVAGERRCRASTMAGLEEIPAIILSDDVDALVFQVSENIQREDLNPIEEAFAFKRLMDEKDFSQADVVRLVGVNALRVGERLSLLKLPEDLRDAVGSYKLAIGCGLVLAKRAKSHREMLEVVEFSKHKLSGQSKGISGITEKSLRNYFDERDMKKVVTETKATLRVTPQESELAREIFSCQAAYLDALTRMVGIGSSKDSAEHCVRLWTSLGEHQQRLFLSNDEMIENNVKTLKNNIKGAKNRMDLRKVQL